MKLKSSIAVLALLASVRGVRADLIPADIMGVGSRLTFTRPVAFDDNRDRKWFCDGADKTPWFTFSKGHCCTVRHGLRAPRGTVTLRAGPRTVNYINWRRTQIMIDAASDTDVRCRSHIVSASLLKKAFGDWIEIDQVVPPVKPGEQTEF